MRPLSRAALTVTQSAADAALAARVACGDCDALDPLYRRHRNDVYRFALLWSGAPAVAADVVQDVFVHLLTHADDFDPQRGALLPWLIGIARNFVRRRSGFPESDPLDDERWTQQRADDATPDVAIAVRQDVEQLRRAIAALPPRYRDVLVLVELAERSYAETAAICGCELNTVRSRLSRARGLLARSLGLHDSDTSVATRG